MKCHMKHMNSLTTHSCPHVPFKYSIEIPGLFESRQTTITRMVNLSINSNTCFASSFEAGFEKSLNCLFEQGQFALIPHFALTE